MYRKNKMLPTSISTNKAYEGETIEKKVARITNNKEPITDGAPLIYTERKNGVQAQYDIRTDRFEIAVEAMDKVTKAGLAKREERHKTPVIDITEGKEGKKEGDGGPESVQTT